MARRFIGSSAPGFVEKAQASLGQAAQSFAQQDRVIKMGEEKKTAGGALGAAAADIEVGQVVAADADGVANVFLVRMNIGFPRAAAANDQSQAAE